MRKMHSTNSRRKVSEKSCEAGVQLAVEGMFCPMGAMSESAFCVKSRSVLGGTWTFEAMVKKILLRNNNVVKSYLE
jgi:hypothetical protein